MPQQGQKSNNEIKQVGPATATECIMQGYDAMTPIMLWGQPGVGKSDTVRQAVKALSEKFGEEFGFIDIRLVQIDSVDLRGLPYKDVRDEQVVMGFAPSGMLPRTGRGILFLDELPQAPMLVQNAASELLLDRKVGEYVLPDGWYVVAAGNRRTDRAGTQEVPSHLKNRLIHLEVVTSVEEWTAWADGCRDKNNDVIRFISSNPKHLNAFDPDRVAYATPRSWSFVMRILNTKPNKKVRTALVAGAVGLPMAMELDAFLDRAKDLPLYEDIIADPANAPIPSSESDAYQILGMISERATLKDMSQVVAYFKRNQREHVRAKVAWMMSRKPELVATGKEGYSKAFHDLAIEVKAA